MGWGEWAPWPAPGQVLALLYAGGSAGRQGQVEATPVYSHTSGVSSMRYGCELQYVRSMLINLHYHGDCTVVLSMEDVLPARLLGTYRPVSPSFPLEPDLKMDASDHTRGRDQATNSARYDTRW